MTSAHRSKRQEDEREFLEGLRAQYAKQGFSLIVEPTPSQLPDFLGTYRPSAIAQKPGANVAIEIWRHSMPAPRYSLEDIRRLLKGHPDWQFAVAFMGSDPLQSLLIARPAAAAVRRSMEEVSNLLAHGQRRAAFIMAWSLLEAALRRVDEESDEHPLTPGTVVQTLAMLGYIDPDIENRMIRLVQLWNRITHGDLEVEPTDEDVELLLRAVSTTLEESLV